MILCIFLDSDQALILGNHLLRHLETLEGQVLEGEELAEAELLDGACMAICDTCAAAGLIDAEEE